MKKNDVKELTCIHLTEVTLKTRMVVFGLFPLGVEAPRFYFRYDLCEDCYNEFVSNVSKLQIKGGKKWLK